MMAVTVMTMLAGAVPVWACREMRLSVSAVLKSRSSPGPQRGVVGKSGAAKP